MLGFEKRCLGSGLQNPGLVVGSLKGLLSAEEAGLEFGDQSISLGTPDGRRHAAKFLRLSQLLSEMLDLKCAVDKCQLM